MLAETMQVQRATSPATQEIVERLQSATLPSDTKGWGPEVARRVLAHEIPASDVDYIQNVAHQRFIELGGLGVESHDVSVTQNSAEGRTHPVMLPEPREPDWFERALPRGERD